MYTTCVHIIGIGQFLKFVFSTDTVADSECFFTYTVQTPHPTPLVRPRLEIISVWVRFRTIDAYEVLSIT